MEPTAKTEPGEALVGMFCHTFTSNGEYQYQGCVQSYLGIGYCLVKLFSALDGNPTCSQIATINDMKITGWKFYESEDEWRSRAYLMLEAMAKEGYTPPGPPPSLGLS